MTAFTFRNLHLLLLAGVVPVLAGCGGSSPFAGNRTPPATTTAEATRTRGAESVAVNRYLWQASLDVLNFLPIESVDPFTGVIVTGFGTPPGGGTAYRATVHISDPALDARALNVALATRSGPVSPDTQRAVEDAILSRARQLRIQDRGL
ncbi:MAG: DUF3576 domain-containing protein [Rubellimicrobium sp.]|nr:DUF3576 domain-containing protein [Rubellimicrobium sp.]